MSSSKQVQKYTKHLLSCERFDSEGRGVCLQDDGKVIFVDSMVPGDLGHISLIKEQKSYNLGHLDSLVTPSPQRVSPECPHFETCGGCQFWHVTAETEIHHKEQNLRYLLKKMLRLNEVKNFQLIKSPSRAHYRNRIQLHYQQNLATQSKNVGLVHRDQQTITPIEQCLIADQLINKAITQQQQNNWPAITKKNESGHIELSSDGQKVSFHLDQKYAAEGFSQVNPYMNSMLHKHLANYFFLHLEKPEETICFDLFGGNGNLSYFERLKHAYVIDYYLSKKERNSPPSTFLHQDLFKSNKDFFKKLETELKINHSVKSPLFFLVDPPRSGFDTLHQWTDHFSPNDILYVSCKADTCLRDIQKVLASSKNKYVIQQVALFDFFPATKHYETFVHLKKMN